MSSVLVRNGHHMRPMLAVLERSGIGALDKYGRGRWIAKSDLPAILEAIRSHPRAMRSGSADTAWLCPGTNIHNWVDYREFEGMFK